MNEEELNPQDDQANKETPEAQSPDQEAVNSVEPGQSPMPRRRFLKKAATLALGGVATLNWLAACGESPTPTAQPTPTAAATATPAPTAIPPANTAVPPANTAVPP